jgi:hypothetical protein
VTGWSHSGRILTGSDLGERWVFEFRRCRTPARDDAGLGAGDGNRTRVASLEDWGSTIELRPRAFAGVRGPAIAIP